MSLATRQSTIPDALGSRTDRLPRVFAFVTGGTSTVPKGASEGR